jgi:hypothetical protein
MLIPKGENPTDVADYRPISKFKINLIPKLIFKVLANRMRQHLSHLISLHQTIFVKE